MGEWSYIFCLFGDRRRPSRGAGSCSAITGAELLRAGQQMVLTPAFWGAEPSYADHGPFKGIRLFQDEERAGLKLMRAFSPSSRSAPSSRIR
jgi:hypothetical protein